MSVVLTVLLVIVGVVLVAWLGLQVKPSPFPALGETGSLLEAVPLAQDLPAPVARFFRELYGDQVPLIDLAVISGRARLRIMGITFPARYRFTHMAGESYRHDIEVTLFGLPLMKVEERSVNGHARLELPFGVSEGPRIDRGANLALWAEAIWFPSLWVTDRRVRRESVDAETAVLIASAATTRSSSTSSERSWGGAVKPSTGGGPTHFVGPVRRLASCH